MSISPAPERLIGANISESIATHLTRWSQGKRILLVHDDQTWLAAGETTADRLRSDGFEVTPYSLGRRPKASHDHAIKVADAATNEDLILAVGSGTVNDVCKSASFARNLPYVVQATAASMNGYCSAGASLEVDGIKDSLVAHAPRAVIADLTILSKAPIRLTRAGIGDTLCRTVVEADMLLSHLLLGTPYPEELFAAMRRHEAVLLGGMLNANGNEQSFMRTLIEALLDSGDAMRAFGSSAVASQSEHMIVHILEARYGEELRNVFHGEMVAVATLACSALQHRMLLGTPTVKPLTYEARQFETISGNPHGILLRERYTKKLLDEASSSAINQKLNKEWPAMREALSAIMLPTKILESAFIHSGLATKPQQIGIADERFRYAASYAHLTRDRFTFLDFSAMNGKRIS